MRTQQEIMHAFTFHPPKDPVVHNVLRDSAREFAEIVFHHVPDCEERVEALNKIQEAAMWANAGLARHG